MRHPHGNRVERTVLYFCIAFVLWVAGLAIWSVVEASASLAAPPPRHAHRAQRIVFWVCPLDLHDNPVTTPRGVCFRDFTP